jgi:hypothetical protein
MLGPIQAIRVFTANPAEARRFHADALGLSETSASDAMAMLLTAGRLNVVLPEIPMVTRPIYVLHAFGRQLPLRARLFIDFLVAALGVDSNLNASLRC